MEFIDEYDFGRFRKITQEAALVLGNEQGTLDLCGLETLDPGVARALSKRKGSIYFYIQDISDEAAKEISNHSDYLYFFRLEKLSRNSAKYLSMHKGNFLAIDGLKELTEDQASELSNYKARLRLSALQFPPEKIAEIMSEFQGELMLPGLTQLGETDAHTKLFAKLLKANSSIEFKHLVNLPSGAAELLLLHPRNYNFPSLKKITDETAHFLGRIPGRHRLDLDGLEELSLSAANALGKFQGFALSLKGLKNISPEVQKALANFKGDYLTLS